MDSMVSLFARKYDRTSRTGKRSIVNSTLIIIILNPFKNKNENAMKIIYNRPINDKRLLRITSSAYFFKQLRMS